MSKKYDARKFLPGLGKQFYVKTTHVDSVGGAEKFMVGLGTEFLIAENDVSSVGGAEKYIPGLGTKFFVHPDHIRWNNSVNITVIDDADAPVESALVYLNGASSLTNASGIAAFTGVPSDTKQSVTVELDGYKLFVSTIEVPNTDAAVEVEIQIQEYFDVTFTVTEGATDIEGASVVFNGETKETDASGVAVFSTALISAAELPYTISKTGFETVEDVVVVTGDEAVAVTQREYHTITFSVSNGSVYTEGATVVFNGETKVTPSGGQIVFTEVFKGVDQAYTVSKTGHTELSTTVTVTVDATVEVLIPSQRTITFNITTEGAALEGASVVFDDRTIVTDVDGLAVFTAVDQGVDQAYTITKDTYTTVVGTKTVTVDATVSEPMTLS